jgi:DNA polymerase III sliding clamp (beta) subunit (PCNA family)
MSRKADLAPARRRLSRRRRLCLAGSGDARRGRPAGLPRRRTHHPARLRRIEDGLVVEAGGQKNARVSEALNCTLAGEPLTIAFNQPVPARRPQHARQADHGLDPKQPAIIEPTGEDGQISSGYWYLVSPVRIGG